MKLGLSFLKNWITPWREYLCELVGTFLFVCVSTYSAYASGLYYQNNIFIVPAVVSLCYLVLVFATVNVSGGFLNPAITLSLWLAQKMSGVKTIFFIVSQILGGLLGFMVGHFGLIGTVKNQPILEFSLGVGPSGAFILESILSAFIVYVVFATIVDKRGPVSFGPLVLGLAVFVANLLATPLTGGFFNLVQVLGYVFFIDDLTAFFVHVAASLIGSIVGMVYTVVFLKSAKKS